MSLTVSCALAASVSPFQLLLLLLPPTSLHQASSPSAALLHLRPLSVTKVQKKAKTHPPPPRRPNQPPQTASATRWSLASGSVRICNISRFAVQCEIELIVQYVVLGYARASKHRNPRCKRETSTSSSRSSTNLHLSCSGLSHPLQADFSALELRESRTKPAHPPLPSSLVPSAFSSLKPPRSQPRPPACSPGTLNLTNRTHTHTHTPRLL